MNRTLSVMLLAAALLPASAQASGPIVYRRFDPEAQRVRLFTVREDGSGERALTRPTSRVEEDKQPAWSPDGRFIAFARSGPTSAYVMRVRPDGTGLANLTKRSCRGKCLGDEEPAVSPDGGRVAFTRAIGPFAPDDGPPAKVALFVMNADGSSVRQLTQRQAFSGTEDHAATWSPDGTTLAFMRVDQDNDASRLLSIDVSTRAEHLLRRMPDRWPGAGSPDWSPDGTSILYQTYCYFGPCGQPSKGAQLYVMRADGSGAHKLTHLPGNSYNGRWSPDGSHIVFARNPRLGPTGEVYTALADGTDVRRVTHAAKLDAHNPDWGPATS